MNNNLPAYGILFLSAMIAACAAWFSITGLVEIFAATTISIIILASILEAGKVVGTFVLHHYWSTAPFYWKYPLTLMVVVLMIITSMGIFGYLSKGHLQQEVPLASIELKLERYDQQLTSIKTQIDQQQSKIDGANKELKILDGIVEKLIEYDKISNKGGAKNVLKNQEERRTSLDAIISESNKKINDLEIRFDEINEKKIKEKSELSSITAKLGPIIYVAKLFNFDVESDDGKGKAVRILIVLLMLAFDPLAIVLVMVGDWMLKNNPKRPVETNATTEEEFAEEAVAVEPQSEEAEVVVTEISAEEIIPEPQVQAEEVHEDHIDEEQSEIIKDRLITSQMTRHKKPMVALENVELNKIKNNPLGNDERKLARFYKENPEELEKFKKEVENTTLDRVTSLIVTKIIEEAEK